MEPIEKVFINTVIARLEYYKGLADKTFAVLNDADFHFQPNEESNSIAVIIQHMSGNMLSRWTDFLTSDGEKEWRKRDGEFEIKNITKAELTGIWEKGWDCCLSAIRSLSGSDLLKTIHIRDEAMTAIDAVNRQLAHYPYHIGQIIYIAKLLKNEAWVSLSIPRKK